MSPRQQALIAQLTPQADHLQALREQRAIATAAAQLHAMRCDDDACAMCTAHAHQIAEYHEAINDVASAIDTALDRACWDMPSRQAWRTPVAMVLGVGW